MTGLVLSLFLLGLAAIDPIGIAAMPILLTQKNPYIRSFIFLLGSFIALAVVGWVFASGLGVIILHFESRYSWLVPLIEAGAGLILCAAAMYLLIKQRKKQSTDASARAVRRRLPMSHVHLFLMGAGLVTVQSIADVVFVIAMIKVAALQPSTLFLFVCITAYAIGALLLQLLVVGAYIATPIDRRARIVRLVNTSIARYANIIVIVISFIFGVGLLVNSALAAMGYAHL